MDYDLQWPILYEKEKTLILGATGRTVFAIEHIGVTAIPGLGAKPIIDVMVAVRHLADARECIEPLKRIGYEYSAEHEALIPERRFFRKGPSDVPNKHYHLHMVEQTSDFWEKHLLFRDYLRAHTNVAQQYCQLKKELAAKHGSNREAYTDAKTAFIEPVVAQARSWRESSVLRRAEDLREPMPKLHLRYVRLPNHVLDIYEELIYRSERVVVGKSQITSAHSVMFNGEVVLAAGFQIVYFELKRKWFTVGKIRDLQGRHTGYYCDIVTPPRLLKDGGVELTDLFLDLWVSPDLTYKVLDEEELEKAFGKGWITKQLYEKAKKELKKLINIVKQGKFPPYQFKQLETTLNL